jgi:single-stranded DNA-binding protein
VVNATVFDATAIEAADKLVKGARVYVEGRITLDEWTAQDGTKRHGLSIMSWHCRLSQIGRNRPTRDRPTNGRPDADFNDDIPL